MSWSTVELGSIINLSKGKKHEPKSEGGNRYINIEDLHNPLNSVFTDDSGTEVVISDLIIAWDGANAGKVGVGYEGVIGSTLARMRIKRKDFDSRFLFWVLVSKNELIKSQRTGATIPHVNGSALKELPIPNPPLPIQKRIADILDAADALRKKDQELLKKHDELAQAIFIDMFGDPVKNEKGWGENAIKNIASKEKNSIKAGPFGSSLKKEFYTPTGYKIYGQEHVIADDLSIGDYFIDEEKYLELKNCEVKEGDVLISLVGTYGKISVVPRRYEKGIINPRLMKISLDKKLFNPFFFKFLLQTSQMYNRMSTYSRGGTMDIVNVGIISELVVITPPLKMQEEFVAALNLLKNQKDVLKKNSLSSCLFDSIIKKAFSGELVS